MVIEQDELAVLSMFKEIVTGPAGALTGTRLRSSPHSVAFLRGDISSAGW